MNFEFTIWKVKKCILENVFHNRLLSYAFSIPKHILLMEHSLFRNHPKLPRIIWVFKNYRGA